MNHLRLAAVFAVGVVLLVGSAAVLINMQKPLPTISPSPLAQVSAATSPNQTPAVSTDPPTPLPASPTVTAAATADAPIAEFATRITKKPFGIHITPRTSPVQPERFSGWHTGVDVEYGDTTATVPVYAIADGEVLVARSASGYGGVVAIRHAIASTPVVAIYGHLDPATLTAVGSHVARGEKIGILGEGGTAQTDGERKHLHFALVKGNAVNLRGYVPSQSELITWHNPTEFLQ